MSKLTDPRDKVTGSFPFSYVSAADTDLHKRFKAERKKILESLKPPRPVSVLERKKSHG